MENVEMNECNLNLGLRIEDIYDMKCKEFMQAVQKKLNMLRLLGATDFNPDRTIVFYKDGIEYDTGCSINQVEGLLQMNSIPSITVSWMNVRGIDTYGNGYPDGATIHIPNMVSTVSINFDDIYLDKLLHMDNALDANLNIHIHGKPRDIYLFANDAIMSQNFVSNIHANVICNGSNVYGNSIDITGIDNAESLKRNNIKEVKYNPELGKNLKGGYSLIVSDGSVFVVDGMMPVEIAKRHIFRIGKDKFSGIQDELKKLIIDDSAHILNSFYECPERYIKSIEDIEFILLQMCVIGSQGHSIKFSIYNKNNECDTYYIKIDSKCKYKKILRLYNNKNMEFIKSNYPDVRIWRSNGEYRLDRR